MARVKIGDIIEIETSRGFFYAQYTHKDPVHGALIQVTREPFPDRETCVEKICIADVGIITFFPLSVAIHRKIFRVVANAEVPKNRAQFPVFRIRGHIDKNGKVKQWKLWAGDDSWPQCWLTELTEEQRTLPVRGIWNDTLLVDRLEAGWAHGDSG